MVQVRTETEPRPKGWGLSLSGGGFRAAFFHVGVLARLAEVELLPQVEVISTVSGGSIVGALYYLHLKRLLEEKGDAELRREDYLDLVATVEAELRRAVQRNIRARVFANPAKLAKMLLPSYSRSERIGDLYDRLVYRAAWPRARDARSLGRETQIAMRELLIEPWPGGPKRRDEKVEFNVDDKGAAAARTHKVPALAINATTLNSGHAWRFEATRMGEELPEDPETRTRVEAIDKNMWLQRAYYEPAPWRPDEPVVPPRHRDFPLALAVAASAAVPGVFHPLSITGLYERMRVQLVDGGVEDNQGLQALHDLRCSKLLISDASGQMADKDRPWPLALSSLLRSNSVAEDRIRDEQLVGLDDEAIVMHLRMGLKAESVPPAGGPRKRQEGTELTAGDTDFGVARGAQHRLSRIRTDLDYFSDLEALSLEADGYLIATQQLPADFAGGAEESWAFHPWLDRLNHPSDDLLDRLDCGRLKFGRATWLWRPLGPLAAAVVLAILAVLVVCCGIADPVGRLYSWCWPVGIAVTALALIGVAVAWSNLKPLLGRLYWRKLKED